MSCAAWRAIDRLRDARDELELAARPPGELVTITRQALDAVLSDIAAAGARIRELAERCDGR
jgi:hypothetical protein